MRTLLFLLLMATSWPASPDISIHVVRHGWHAGIALPRAHVPPGVLAESAHFGKAEHLEIGWGDRDFYMTPGFNACCRIADRVDALGRRHHEPGAAPVRHRRAARGAVLARRSRMKRQKRTRKTVTGFAATRGRRDVIKQAASDLEHGLEDTDCRVPAESSERHCPRPRPGKKKA